VSGLTCRIAMLRKISEALPFLKPRWWESEDSMFNSTILDVAVGLIFSFLAISFAVSAIVEALASIMKWRSRTLLSGIKELLSDPQFNGLALDIYNHALVNPRDSGLAKQEQDLRSLPAYIDPAQFAEALIDITKITEDSPEKIKFSIDANIKNRQLNLLLKGIVDRSAGDLGKIRDQLASWFDNGMDRISGVYKRKTQLWSFMIALILTGLFNVSAISIGNALWQRPMLARTIAPMASLTPVDAVKQLEELDVPIGWTQAKVSSLWSWKGLQTFLGWLITAVATLFGAPFWFDTLERVVRLKGSGPSPAEKRSDSGAAA